MFNYKKVSSSLLKGLLPREKEVLARRFGLEGSERETLESIGKDFGVSRERVRQIENKAISKIKPQLVRYKDLTDYFIKTLKKTADFRKEELLLSQLGEEKEREHIFFLLHLSDAFIRFPETKERHALWTISPESFSFAQELIDVFYRKLKKVSRPISLDDFEFPKNHPWAKLSPKKRKNFLKYSLELSKIIFSNQEGLYGLKDWPEVNPRFVKDKAYLLFKKEGRPLHFLEAAELIGSQVNFQTLHNELIRDPRFVLVGRGIYALKEWGYEEGYVKDIILKILQKAKKPLSKDEILQEVLKRKLVKKNTVLLNLANKKYFLRTPQGKYTFHQA